MQQHASLTKTKPDNKNASLDLRFQSLVWAAEYDVKTPECTQIFLSVFSDPEVFENGGFRKRISVDRP